MFVRERSLVSSGLRSRAAFTRFPMLGAVTRPDPVKSPDVQKRRRIVFRIEVWS
jgi:hypothetical protein